MSTEIQHSKQQASSTRYKDAATSLDVLQYRVSELEQENTVLRNRVDKLEKFAGLIAHELKNPILTVRGFAGILKEYYARLSPEEIGETAELIVEESVRFEELIDSMLLYSRVDDSVQIETAPLDMQSVVENAFGKLMYQVTKSNAHIRYPDEWPTAIGYAPWVEHLWTNFISNAIKYGGKPPVIELGAAAIPEQNSVAFWVKDNGRGMNPEQQAQAFHPFTRFDKQAADGNGLGLAIAAGIAEKLGGSVDVTSTLGEGSTFMFLLPISTH